MEAGGSKMMHEQAGENGFANSGIRAGDEDDSSSTLDCLSRRSQTKADGPWTLDCLVLSLHLLFHWQESRGVPMQNFRADPKSEKEKPGGVG